MGICYVLYYSTQSSNGNVTTIKAYYMLACILCMYFLAPGIERTPVSLGFSVFFDQNCEECITVRAFKKTRAKY